MHDRVNVVVKSNYWSLVENNALYIYCNDDSDESPIMHCYYEDKAVCAAGLGSTIGAGAGAIGGIILGALAGAAIGCATVILCLLAIIVALVVAAAVVPVRWRLHSRWNRPTDRGGERADSNNRRGGRNR